MAVNYCHAEYPEKAPTLAPSPLVNRLNSLFDFFKGQKQFAGIRASRLSHVRSAAAALSADCCRGNSHQVNRRIFVCQVFRNTNDNRCFAVFIGCQNHNARTDVLAHLVNKGFQFLRMNVRDNLADKFHAVDNFRCSLPHRRWPAFS